jgi:flagellar hook-length control protein FliK
MSNPRWSDGLGDTVRWMVHSGQQHAELSINPPELGPVEISVTLEADRASVVFVAPHATTREALEASLPRLHGLLAEAGIALDNAQVGADAQAGGQERQRPQHARAQAAAEDNTPRVWREASGAVDIYA